MNDNNLLNDTQVKTYVYSSIGDRLSDGVLCLIMLFYNLFRRKRD